MQLGMSPVNGGFNKIELKKTLKDTQGKHRTFPKQSFSRLSHFARSNKI